MTILVYDLVGRDEKRPFSPHCWKATMALAHKGLDFECVPTRFLDVTKVENGIAKSVPIIRDGDKVIADSFAIALYLDEAYPERPTLFAGEGGKAMARFIERWAMTQLHPFLGSAALLEICHLQDAENEIYFRTTREQRYGKKLEEVGAERDAHLSAFRKKLDPLRSMLEVQPFIGGNSPLFADYIVFGALQWVRVSSTYAFLDNDDTRIRDWFERCLDLHDGLGRKTAAAA